MPTEEIPPNAAPNEPPGAPAADLVRTDHPLPAETGAAAPAPDQPGQPANAADAAAAPEAVPTPIESASTDTSAGDAPTPTPPSPDAGAPHPDGAADPTTAPVDADSPDAPAAAEPAVTEAAARGLSPAQTAARLAELFPALFAGPPKPIKLRIQADIQQRVPDLFTRRVLSFFLSRHTTTTPYLKALVTSQQRFDLDGQPAGDIAPEHLQAATEELARRRQIVETRRAAERADRAQRAQAPQGAARGPTRVNAGPEGEAAGSDPARTDPAPRGPAREGAGPGGRPMRQEQRPRRPDRRPERGTDVRAPGPGGAAGSDAQAGAGPRDDSRGGQRTDSRTGMRPPRSEGSDHRDRRDRPAQPPRPDFGRQDARPAPRGPGPGPGPGHGPGHAAQRPPAEFVPADPARRERAFLLRAWETSSLTKANFCALKRLTEAEFDAQLDLARQERSGARSA